MEKSRRRGPARLSSPAVSPGCGDWPGALGRDAGSQQRGWTVAAALLLAGLLGGLFWYGLRTDWRTLYADLDPDDARQTGVILTQAQIPFDVTDTAPAFVFRPRSSTRRGWPRRPRAA